MTLLCQILVKSVPEEERRGPFKASRQKFHSFSLSQDNHPIFSTVTALFSFWWLLMTKGGTHPHFFCYLQKDWKGLARYLLLHNKCIPYHCNVTDTLYRYSTKHSPVKKTDLLFQQGLRSCLPDVSGWLTEMLIWCGNHGCCLTIACVPPPLEIEQIEITSIQNNTHVWLGQIMFLKVLTQHFFLIFIISIL